MVSKEKLEDILHDEEVEARWESINTKKLNEKARDREWYLNYTKKEYHPISYQIKQELDEWERNNPLFQQYKGFDQDERGATSLLVFYLLFWFSIGFVVAKAILLL
jgi:hypothetical protein